MDNEQADEFSQYERQRRMYLDEWRVSVQPLDADVRAYNRGAIDFALSGLKTMALLNGGALVLFPAFAAFFGVSADTSTRALLEAGGCFVAGLVLTALANLCAYFTMVRQGLELSKIRAASADKVNTAYGMGVGQAQSKKSAGKSTKKSEFPRSEIWRYSGIVAVFLSLGAFILGTYWSGAILLPQ